MVKRICLLVPVLICLSSLSLFAQLAKDNPCKFLGNITTRNAVPSDYKNYWNQITPENESKWGVVEGTRDKMNWSGCDAAYNYARKNGLTFKFHTLVWGSQYPKWMDNLSQQEQYDEIVEWFDAVKARYPDLEMIDVVNEAVAGHAPAPYKNALGGDGASGFDWIVNAFKMARERWPDAILIYNDYNTFQWQINECIDLMQKIIKAGAPVDAFGAQSHDLNDMGGAQFKAALEKLHNGIGLPIYITEYDIAKYDDQEQLQRYKEQFPIMWEADYVAGVTLWGYVYGATWTKDGNSGLIKDGVDRPAFTWLKQYMQTEAAKNAKNPLCGGRDGMKLTLSVADEDLYAGDETKIIAEASGNKGVNHIDFFVNGELLVNKYIAPYEYPWTPAEAGEYEIKLVAYDEDFKTTEKTMTVKVLDNIVFDMANGVVTVETEEMPETGGPYIGGYSKNFDGMSYYANGDYTAFRFAVDGEDEEEYEISVVGCSDDVEDAKAELILDGKVLQTLVWSSPTADTVKVVAKLSNKQIHKIMLNLVGDVGQSDLFLDKVILRRLSYVEPSTGVGVFASDAFVIAPNPVKEYFEIVTDEEVVSVELLDMHGRVLKRKNTKRISLQDISSGSYVVKIYTNTEMITKKILKFD